MKSIMPCILLVLILFTPIQIYAWEGEDAKTGGYIEIDSGNLVRNGSSIEFYDHSTGQYHDADVESVNRYGGTIEVEVYDSTIGEYRTFEMED